MCFYEYTFFKKEKELKASIPIMISDANLEWIRGAAADRVEHLL